MLVGYFINKRIAKFTQKFPDAIELLVRGLRSGLPITETIGVVGAEIDGPVGEEFRSVSDKMKIGKSLDTALQETADRLGTPEFQFFTITIQIQRETGGNLAETLANLADDAHRLGDRQARAQAAHEQLDRVGEFGGELVDAPLDEEADRLVRQADADEQAEEQRQPDRRAVEEQ